MCVYMRGRREGRPERCSGFIFHGLVTKSCPTLVAPWTVAHQAPLSMGILQARVLEWIAISFSRGYSRPRDRTHVSCIAFFTD